jgi:hypothetical protein
VPVGAASVDEDEEMARVARMIEELAGIFIVKDNGAARILKATWLSAKGMWRGFSKTGSCLDLSRPPKNI